MICWDAGIHWVVSRLVFIPLAKTRPRNFLLYYHYISKNVYTVKSLKTNENLFVAINFVVRMFCWCLLLKNIFCSINPFSFVYTDRSIFGETVLGFSIFNHFFFFQNLRIPSNENCDVKMWKCILRGTQKYQIGKYFRLMQTLVASDNRSQ